MSPTVRALPLWQPWASLVVHGAKRIETRHWPAPPSIIGQRIAIHATKTRAELGVIQTQPFNRVLLELRVKGALSMSGELPFGALIGTVVVAGCDRMTVESCTALEYGDPDEFAFGFHAPGRFAWLLTDPRPLAEPVPWRGSQGIFSVPANVLDGHVAEPAQGTLL